MNPTELFQRGERVKEQLLYLVHSRRNQLLVLGEWIEQLLATRQPHAIRTFLLEASATFLPYCAAIPAVGTPPSFFGRMLAILDGVQLHLGADFSPDEIHAARRQVMRGLRTAYAFLGTPYLAEGQAETSRDVSALLGERHRLDAYLHGLRASDETLLAEFASIAAEWDARLRLHSGSVNIPLLEDDRSHGMITNFVAFGTASDLVQTLTLLDGDAGRDILLFTHESGQQARNGGRDDFNPVLAAVRSALPSLIGKQGEGYFQMTAGFPDSSLHYTGRSLELGLGVNASCLLTKHWLDRSFFLPQASCVFTGCLDAEGNVTALPDEQVALKVATVFFSPYALLVLPKVNEATAQTELTRLQREYAARNLELLPIRHLKDVFHSRLAVAREYRTFPQRMTRKARRHAGKIAVVSAAICACLVIAYLVGVHDWDDDPSYLTMHDNRFIIYNAKGRLLWKMFISHPDMPTGDALLERMFPPLKTAIVCDVNADGHHEVVLGHHHSKAGFSDSIYCYNSDRSRRWATPLGMPIETGEGRYTSMGDFKTLTLDSFRTATGLHFVVSACNAFYTNIVYILNGHGNVESSYLHLGVLAQSTIVKDPRTGDIRIFLAGTLNALREAVVVELDPMHAGGVGPQIGQYTLKSPALPSAHEVCYLKFPTPDIEPWIRGEQPQMAFIRASSDTMVTFQVDCGVVPPAIANSKDPVPVSVYYEFDTRTRQVVNIKTSTHFDEMFKRLRREARIHSVLDDRYKQSLMDRVGYWDGSAFVPHPRAR
jgi:hypothetical protein